MSSSDRRTLIAGALSGGALMALSGCFRPMLAESSDASRLRGRVALPGIAGRRGYQLTRQLERRLGRPQNPDHRLEVDLAFDDRGLAIAPDDAVTRITITATAAWRLYRRGETTPVLVAREVSEAGYNATGSLYAGEIARRDIEDRLARDLGERIARTVLARADTVLESAS